MLAAGAVLTLAAATPAAAGEPAERPGFTPCADADAHPALGDTQCAQLAVPLDHGAPATGTIDLFVRKFPARGAATGELWLIAGGPGESGAS
ncbi:MAG TPA: alpha/beta hydrolase, partial [Erythrobacter sp.]|nr:alpha/beta hydrolase [Erythrobacter sp.]